MKKTINIFNILVILMVGLISCGEDNSSKKKVRKPVTTKRTGNPQIDMWTDVKTAETIMYNKKKTGQVSVVYYKSYFTRLVEFYEKYPNDPKADSCLMAICVTETGYPIGDKKHFAIQEQYGDTLLKRFPKSKFRIFVLENLIYMYDQSKASRDTKKLTTYYTMLLKEIPNNAENKERRSEIENRMKNIDKPIQFK